VPQKFDENTTGFNMQTQKLHCLMLLDDELGLVMSSKASDSFWRAFIVEDRATGEIQARMRFRYNDGDSWTHICPKDPGSVHDRVEKLAAVLEAMMRLALSAAVQGSVPVPEAAVKRFYPPEPGDSQKVLEYLIQQDLVVVKKMFDPEGKEIPMSPTEGHA
jgi:hypothetical protein